MIAQTFHFLNAAQLVHGCAVPTVRILTQSRRSIVELDQILVQGVLTRILILKLSAFFNTGRVNNFQKYAAGFADYHEEK